MSIDLQTTIPDSEASREGECLEDQAKGHLCCILAKIMLKFRPCPKNLSEMTLKNKQTNLIGGGNLKIAQHLGCVAWSLLAAFSQLYSENSEQNEEQEDVEKKKKT